MPTQRRTGYASNSPLKQEHDFRLLRFIREPDAEREPRLRCKLERYRIGSEQCPEYAAISYCWGKSSTVKPVIVNGSQVAVNLNLASAVQQLFEDDRRDEKYLWADALCIEQDNLREKEKQIRLMPQIFANATKVITWLSHEKRDADHLAYLSTAQLRDPNQRNTQEEFLRVVNNLSRKNYWHRMWIVQELSLAQEIEVVCRNQRVSWDKFVSLMCDHLRLPSASNPLEQEPTVLTDNRIVALDTMRREVQSGVDIPPLKALYSTRACQSTNKADRIFTVLGLTSNYTSKMGRLNYRDRHSVTLLKMTLAEMMESGRVDHITFPDPKDRASQNLRAWAPNWIHRPLWQRLRVWQLHHVLQIPGYSFSATLADPQLKCDWQKGELKLSGHSLGTICLEGPIDLKYRSQSSLIAAAEILLEELPDESADTSFPWTVTSSQSNAKKRWPSPSLSKSILKLDDSQISLSSTSSSDQILDTTVLLSKPRHYRQCLQKLLRYVGFSEQYLGLSRESSIFRGFSDGDDTPATTPDLRSESGESSRFSVFESEEDLWTRFGPSELIALRAQFASELRTLLHQGSSYCTQSRDAEPGRLSMVDMQFTGTSSGLLGLARGSVQNGDAVYLINGCSVPVVLRPKANSPSGVFEVVGEMLMLGLMNGEFFSGSGSGAASGKLGKKNRTRYQHRGTEILSSSFKRTGKETIVLA